MKQFLKATGLGRAVLALALLSCLSISASAASITWTLTNVGFKDGGIATGSFTFDTIVGKPTAWNISVSLGDTANFAPFIYTTANGILSTPTDNYFLFSNAFTRYLSLATAAALPTSGGTVALVLGDGKCDAGFSNEANGSHGCREVTSGSLVGVAATATPEPTTLLLTGLGIAALALRRRVRV
jgi:hypothetical protein